MRSYKKNYLSATTWPSHITLGIDCKYETKKKRKRKPILSVSCPCLSTTSTNILNSEKLLFLLTLGCIPVKMTLQLRWMRGRAALLVLMIINNKLIFFKVLLIYNEQLVNICFNTWRSRSFSLINHTHHEI